MKCKYYKKCIHFRKNSYTCNHDGDIYCGIFRVKELSKAYKSIAVSIVN